MDYFTKFSIAKAIPDFTALTKAVFFFEEVICKMGMPKSVISDKGVNFQSKLLTTRPSTSPAGVSITTRVTTTLLSGVVSTTRPVTIPAVTSIVISFIRIQTTTKRTITTKATTTSAYSSDWFLLIFPHQMTSNDYS